MRLHFLLYFSFLLAAVGVATAKDTVTPLSSVVHTHTELAVPQIQVGRSMTDQSGSLGPIEIVYDARRQSSDGRIIDLIATAVPVGDRHVSEITVTGMDRTIWHTVDGILWRCRNSRPALGEVRVGSQGVAGDNDVAVKEWGIRGKIPDRRMAQGFPLNITSLRAQCDQ